MKKIFSLIVVLLSVFLFIDKPKAEEFTEASRFQWWTYKNTDTQLSAGTGYINDVFFGDEGLSRVQWLYQSYTYYPNWYYDISFTVDTTGNYELHNFIEYITRCEIAFGDGKTYQCNLSKSGNFFTISASNLTVTNERNTLWLNIYANGNTTSQFITSHYSLNIYNKEDKSITSENLNNAINSIISNQKENINNIINNQNQNQQQTNEKLDNLNDSITSEDDDFESKKCGMICKLKKLPSMIIDGIKSIFIPSDMDFITDFVDSIESKLGFIASVPIQLIEFILNLASASWEEVTSVSLPTIDIFGYKFWNAQDIDITMAINIFKPFKYITDLACVILCCKTLLKWYENFTGGGNK